MLSSIHYAYAPTINSISYSYSKHCFVLIRTLIQKLNSLKSFGKQNPPLCKQGLNSPFRRLWQGDWAQEYPHSNPPAAIRTPFFTTSHFSCAQAAV